MGIILPDNRDVGIIWKLYTDEFVEGIIEKISDNQFPGYFTSSRWAPQAVRGKVQRIFKAKGNYVVRDSSGQIADRGTFNM